MRKLYVKTVRLWYRFDAYLRPPRDEFEAMSLKERGRVLRGKHAHWCDDWDGLTMDETCMEWPCACYK